MTPTPPDDHGPRLIDRAFTGAENAMHGAQAALDGALHQAGDGAHRGVSALRDGSQRLLGRAQHAGDGTVAYIRGEPMKAVLMAAAAGAALVLLAGLLGRRR